jgi:hypothetical protein
VIRFDSRLINAAQQATKTGENKAGGLSFSENMV